MADSVTTASTKEKSKAEVKPKVMTLAERMDAITDDAFGIGKDNIKMTSKKGVDFTIKGHTFEAVLSEMRPMLAHYGVSLVPNLIERTFSGNRCDVLIDFTFRNREDPKDTEVIRWGGSGCDDGDKGFSKAGTNCVKEMLKKRFLITDRDDAKEEEEKVEHRTDEGISRAQVDKVEAKAKAAVEKWAETFRLTVMKASTEKEISRLYRDASKQLGDLPEVTRQFFTDLREKRMREINKPKEDDKPPTKEEQLAMDQRLAEEEGE